MNLYTTPFVHLFELSSSFPTHCLFNTLTLQVAYGSSVLKRMRGIVTLEEFDDNGQELIRRHLLGRFLFPTQDALNGLYSELRERGTARKITNLRLLLTNKCNFACTYCQICKNLVSDYSTSMSHHVVDAALSTFASVRSQSSPSTVTITGGEPLVERDLVRYAILEAKRLLGDETRVVVFTNGTLCDEEIAAFFRDHAVLVLVSLDGTKEVHDRARIKKNGQGTFEESFAGLQLYQKVGCNVGVSSVLGSHNIHAMEEITEYFADIGVLSLGMNFPHYLLEKENPVHISAGEYTRKLIACFHIARERGLYLEQVRRRLDPFVREEVRFGDCQAIGGGITVDPRGYTAPCKTLLTAQRIGSPIQTTNVLEDDLYSTWARRSPFFTYSCLSCPALGLCGGGCAYDAYSCYGTIDVMEERTCTYTLGLLRFMLQELGSHLKGGEDFMIPTKKEKQVLYGKLRHASKIAESVGHELSEQRSTS